MRRLFPIVILMLLAVTLALRESRPSCLQTTASAARAPEKCWILIELAQKRLTLYQGTEKLQSYPIASGTADTPSPIGVFRINGRFSTEMSGFGTRFLSLNVSWGKYGIHGTNKPGSIGQNASHGCIRMLVKDAESLYSRVPNWIPVVIEGGPYGELDYSLKTLRPGDRGSAVCYVQKRLSALGFYHGSADGIYGSGMSGAVLRARKAHRLNEADIVDAALYRALGIILFD